MKDAIVGMVCLPTTVIATRLAWQEHVEWGLRIVSLLIAIGASLAMWIFYHRRTAKLDAERIRGRDGR